MDAKRLVIFCIFIANFPPSLAEGALNLVLRVRNPPPHPSPHVMKHVCSIPRGSRVPSY